MRALLLFALLTLATAHPLQLLAPSEHHDQLVVNETNLAVLASWHETTDRCDGRVWPPAFRQVLLVQPVARPRNEQLHDRPDHLIANSLPALQPALQRQVNEFWSASGATEHARTVGAAQLREQSDVKDPQMVVDRYMSKLQLPGHFDAALLIIAKSAGLTIVLLVSFILVNGNRAHFLGVFIVVVFVAGFVF